VKYAQTQNKTFLVPVETMGMHTTQTKDHHSQKTNQAYQTHTK